MSEIGIQEILKLLPHRYPFILIDKVVDFEPQKSLTAIKNVSINEPYFTGHFPENPIMPGVLILEALAQACVVFAFQTTKTMPSDGVLYLFAGINKARFKRMVVPGDQLRLEVELVNHKRGIWKMFGKATVDGQLACSAELLSATKDINQ